jgi:hypothetical protein
LTKNVVVDDVEADRDADRDPDTSKIESVVPGV